VTSNSLQQRLVKVCAPPRVRFSFLSLRKAALLCQSFFCLLCLCYDVKFKLNWLVLYPGTTAQWGKVEKRSKDRSRSKVKESSSVGANIDSYPSSSRTRGSRVSHEGGRGGHGGRGGSEFRTGRGGRSRGANGRSRQSPAIARKKPKPRLELVVVMQILK